MNLLANININTKKIVYFFLLVITISFVGVVTFGHSAHAADLQLPSASDKKIQNLLLNRAVGFCLKTSNLSGGFGTENGYRIGPEAATAGDWFSSVGIVNEANTGPYMSNAGINGSSSVDTRCGSKEMVSKFLSNSGLNGIGTLCAIGFVRSSDPNGVCPAGNGVLQDNNPNRDITSQKFRSQNPEPSLTDEDWYWFYRKTFALSCGAGKMTSGVITADQYSSNNGPSQFGYRLLFVTTSADDKVVVNGETLSHAKFVYISGSLSRDESVKTRLGEGPGYNVVSRTCAQIEGHILNYGALLAKKTATLTPEEIADNQENTVDAGAGTVDEATSCVIEGIGWLVCPVVNFTAGVADGAFGFLASSFLETPAQAFTTDSQTYKVWVIVRNVANILFVIVFLFIIFSQLTGQGVSNYGIKKMLPRLVVGAVLVNVSFFISQIAVDLSNILGYSINNVFDSITLSVMPENYNPGQGSVDNTTSFSAVALTILGGAVAGLALYALLSTFIPIIVAVILALVLIVFILIARQALIILLVVLSPVAFVALLLPNTEKWFKQWRKMFTALLLLFPIVALIFGASSLASVILKTTFTAGYTGEGSGSDIFGQIIAAAVMILPLFLVPVVLKKSLDGIPMIGQMAGKWQNRANGGLSNKVKDSYQRSTIGRGAAIRKQKGHEYLERKFADRVAKGGFSTLSAKGLNVVTGKGRFSRNAVARIAEDASEKAIEGDINAMAVSLKSQHKNPDTQIADVGRDLATAIANDDVITARAAQSILLNSGGAGLDMLHNVIDQSMSTETKDANGNTVRVSNEARRNSKTGTSLRNALNNAGIKGKDNALASWAYTPGATVSQIQNGTAVARDANGKVETDDSGRPKTVNPYSGLSSVELAGQRAQLFNSDAAKSLVNPEQAEALLADTVSKDMSPSVKKMFTDIADGRYSGGVRSQASIARAAAAANGGTVQATTQAQTGPVSDTPETIAADGSTQVFPVPEDRLSSQSTPATQTAGTDANRGTVTTQPEIVPTPGPAPSSLPPSQRFSPNPSQPSTDGSQGNIDIQRRNNRPPNQ